MRSRRVTGHSWRHFRQHHVNNTDLPLIVVSATSEPLVPQ
jgi:hypothetical protein